MRTAWMLLVAALLLPALLGGCPNPAQAPPGGFPDGGIDVYFSPKGGCTDAILEQIGRAKSTIDVQAYSFTSKPIAQALVEAHRRKVKVRVILDKSQRAEKYTSATHLYNEGVPTYIDSRHAIAHNKIIIIDSSTLITGSFNFSAAAENENAENLLIIQARPELIQKYTGNFEAHLAHSQPYSR